MSDEPRLLESFRNPIFWIALFIGSVVVITAVAYTGLSEFGPFKLFSYGELLDSEGRGVELAEMIFDLITFAAAVAFAVRFAARRRFFLPYGLYFFLLAMEESDWLQQVLGYQSPAFFARYNKFGTTNIHNLLIFVQDRSIPAGQAFSLGLLLLPMALFLLYSFWRAYKGDFLGRVVAVFFFFAFVAECIPFQPVFQLLLGVFALAYAAIAATVQMEREREQAASMSAVGDSTGQS